MRQTGDEAQILDLDISMPAANTTNRPEQSNPVNMPLQDERRRRKSSGTQQATGGRVPVSYIGALLCECLALTNKLLECCLLYTSDAADE